MKPNSLVLSLLAAGFGLFASWFWWTCEYDSRVAFLPGDHRAAWIVYPKPPDTLPRHAISFTAVFHRNFVLDAVPADARLSVRLFRQGAVALNGQPVGELAFAAGDWKRIRASEITKYLRAGTNEISITVSNSMGPPALWLALESSGPGLRSDTEWQASLAGAEWQPAVMADQTPVIRAGNFVFGRERLSTSLRQIWPVMLVIFLVSSGLLVVVIRSKSNLSASPSSLVQRCLSPAGVLILILLLWVILFCNNLPQMPAILGFDRDGHLQYIDYLLQKKALPLADEGWTMYQPPLYYLLSALTIGPFGVSASAEGAVLALRAISGLIGIIHLVLIFLCLRLVFPTRPGAQIAGLLLAGFLPANICLSHHITNEVLAAMFLTAALYFTLRLLYAPRPGPIVPASDPAPNSEECGPSAAKHPPRWFLQFAIGVCLGLSLLTKFSALLAIPIILVATAWRDLVQTDVPKPANTRSRFAAAFRSVTIVSLAVFATCGWHYFRVWRHFGTPLIGNWDPRLPFAWWQDPGYHTAGWFWRAGQTLVAPSFSSLYSLADGLYTSLWGDGLISGGARMGFRPPWNYDLMNGGYVLALVPLALVLAGMIVAFARFMRRPTIKYFLILALMGAFGVGILLMALRVPSYAQVKSFYALPALLPFCILGALGWEFVARRGAAWRWLASFGLLAWALTAFGSLWIRALNPFTPIANGVSFADDKLYAEAIKHFKRALALDPHSLAAGVGLTGSLALSGQIDEASKIATLTLAQHPEAADALMQIGEVVATAGRIEEGAGYLKRSIALAPDNPGIYLPLALCMARLGRNPELIEVCRQGLRVDPSNPELRQRLAGALSRAGDFSGAIEQLGLAQQLNPNLPEIEGALAFALFSSGRLEEATPHFEAALKQKPGDAKLNYLYALTLAAQRRTTEAVVSYRAALSLQPEMVEALNNLAWLLAVSPDARLRNGPEAVRLAEHACNLTQRREPVLLGTLAAAYAETGRFEDAVSAGQMARKLATDAGQKELADKNQELLDLYRAHQPYRDPAAADR